MISPYRQTKETRGLELPEVRVERQYGQRLFTQLWQAEHLKRESEAHQAQQKFSQWATKAFPETLREITPDLHAACEWASNQTRHLFALPRAVVLFCGCLLNGKEVSIAIPLIKRAHTLAAGNRELSAVCSINSAIAHRKFSPEIADDEWLKAIRQMPLTEWSRYPTIVQGAFITLQLLRASYEQQDNFPNLLEAASIAERAFIALSSNAAKSTSFQSMPSAVGLLIEVAAIHKATAVAGIPPLAIPPPGEILKLAAVNAGMNTANTQLFPRALMHLAHHHLQEGEKDAARDYAIQGKLACMNIPSCDPDLTRAFDTLIRSTLTE